MNVFNDGQMYFATSYRKDEIECLKEIKPPHLLTSFAMWRTKRKDKTLKDDLIYQIDYEPERILIDSGAYTFRDVELGLEEMIETYSDMIVEDGKPFDLNNDHHLTLFAHWWMGEFDEAHYLHDKNGFYLFQQYINFLCWNRDDYDYCFAFDQLGDNQTSLLAYRVMRALGLPVIPVYQAATVKENVRLNEDDLAILDSYAATSPYIGIGGTAIKQKGYTKQDRITIVQSILKRHPTHKFHLLGTLDEAIIEACPELYSFDGQSWVQKVKKYQKLEKTKTYLTRKIEWFEGGKTDV